jgi:alpha-L-fucosidase
MVADIKLTQDWYQQAKFGLFIHWGAYSVAGVEASWPIMAPDLSEVIFGTSKRISQAEYLSLPTRFNPVEFDPQAWVRIAQAAGMRYIVITVKHHDGFCMFDAPGTDYKITNTPYGKDICLELAQACAYAGMPLGFYYSPPDMHHPGYRDTRKPVTQNWLGEPKRKEWSNYLDYMESHIHKLLTGYGEVSILWFDGLANHGKYDPQRFHRLIRTLSPGTLINDRLGDDYDFITPEQFIPKEGIPIKTGKPPSGMDPGGDVLFKTVTFLFKVPGINSAIRKQMQKYQGGTLTLTPVLQAVYPSPENFQPWETCMTMGKTWGYNPQETDWKDPKTLVQNLVEVVSRGGNYLLNIGPTDRGTFPKPALDRLHEIGEWLSVNAEAIYGSTYPPLASAEWGRATRKGNKLYLHIFDWPSHNQLLLDPFPFTAQAVNQMAGGALEFSQSGSRLTIQLPSESPGSLVPVVVVEFEDKQRKLTDYSPVKDTRLAPSQYLKAQNWANAWINSLLNGRS